MTDGSRRVLVVDDDPLVRMLMVDILEDAGFEILEASGADEACELINYPDNLDLVVTDLNMPGADGTVVAKHARNHHPKVPVLFVSGRPDLLREMPFQYRYLAKPFSMQQLVETVHQMVPAV